MFSHAHAFRPGFTLPKAAMHAWRTLRKTPHTTAQAPLAKVDPRLHDDLGLTARAPSKPGRTEV